MMFRSFALVFLLTASSGFGQQINVRSGAHDGFARLVLDTPSGQGWRIENTDVGARILLENRSQGFDTSRVFDRIDRTYLDAVSSTSNTLELSFACECIAEAFAQGSNMIVIDVSAKTVQNSDDATVQTRPQSDLRFVGVQTLRFGHEKNETSAKQEIPKRPSQIVSAATVPLLSNITPKSTASPPEQSDSIRLQQAQTKIVERISDAATRGMLRATRSPIDLPIVASSPQIDVRIFDSSAQDDTPDTSPTGGNVRVSSSSDSPFQRTHQVSTSTTLGVRCIDPKLTDVPKWGPEIGFAHEVARLRGQLFAEFDRLDIDSAQSLARTYVYFGFGAEARQILEMDSELSKANRPLLSLADILEYGHERGANYLEHFVDCDTSVALWAILSLQSVDPSLTINTDAALRALTGLPVHLRSFIAADLSRKLLEYGDETAAAAALRSIERTADPLSPNANLAKAKIELAQGKTDLAQDRLADVVSSNTEQSAEALVKFVETQLAQNGEIGYDVATLVEAYAIELRDDPLGADLRRAHVLALGKSRQFGQAFAALERIRDRKGLEDDNALRASLLDLLTTDADDIAFLNLGFAQIGDAPETIQMSTRVRLAARLNSLGFAKQAEQLVAVDTPKTETSDQKILRAELAMALSRPYEAIAQLHGVKGEKADAIRADARLATGEFDEANRLYSNIGDTENGARTAWLSNSWTSLIEEDAPVLGTVAQVAQTELDLSEDPVGMLARAETAISESQSAREAITELLNVNTLEP